MDATPTTQERRLEATAIGKTLLHLVQESESRRAQMLAALRPTAEDLKAIFVPEAAAAAARAYGRQPLEILAPGAVRAVTRVAKACELAAPPPGWDKGYAVVAPWLRPGSIWVAWTYLDAQDREIRSFDGVVIRDGRACWCPRAWRFLADLGVAERASILGYWID